MKFLHEWRNYINSFVLDKTQIYKRLQDLQTVIEVGPENSTSGIIRNLFPNLKTLDFNRPDLKIDYIADLCKWEDLAKLNLEESCDAIYCLEVLEHTTTPWTASQNLIRMLKPGGLLFMSVPSFLDHHPHGYGLYGDYWRFLPGHIPHLFPGLETTYVNGLASTEQLIGMVYILKKK